MWKLLFVATSVMVSAFGQANTSLSNLSSTAVNTDLIPGTDKGPALGSASLEFKSLNIGSNGAFDNSTFAPGIDVRTNGAVPTTLRQQLTNVSGQRGLATSSAIVVPTTSTSYESDAISGIILNNCPTSGSTCNGAVAGSFFAAPGNAGLSSSTAGRNNVWALNTLLDDTDDIANNPSGFNNVSLQNEFDFNVFNTNTQVIGMSLGGASSAQPSSAIGIIIQALGNGFGASPIQWNTGFATQIGCCEVGLAIGPVKYAASSASQSIELYSYDSGFTALSSSIVLDSSGNLVLPAASSGAVFFQAGGMNAAAATAAGFNVYLGTVYISGLAGGGGPQYACINTSGGIYASPSAC